MKSLLRYLLLVVIAIALGAVPAYLYQKMESQTPEAFFNDEWTATSDTSLPFLAIVGSNQHDFGSIKSDGTHTCEFLVENQGGGVLEIWFENGSKTFKTDLGSDHVSIAAGSTYPVSFSFDSSKLTGEFNENVSIQSNDVENGNATVEFKISGKVE